MVEIDERVGDMNKTIGIAAKWSSITQLATKLITPLTNVILARLLAPEAFGVIATITMVVSFIELLTDSGFHKYLVQRNFKCESDKYKYANVAFWTSFALSIVLWGIVVIFSTELAKLVGSPGLETVLIVACIQLPIMSFSSVQIALFKRAFDFKTLFTVKITTFLIPFAVTIPLAYLGFSYWSLIISMILTQATNSAILTLKSQWKPRFSYDWMILRSMISFSIWSLVEAISIWLTTWVDIFIIGYYFNEHYLGIYKTSTMMVGSLLAIVTASIVPVLFSALSRLQEDNNEFIKLYFKFQRLASIVIFPLGVGVFLYSEVATQVMLGDRWSEASNVIGIWGLTSAVMTVLSSFCSEAYRAKGKPKLSFLAQILHLIVLVPTCIVVAKYGFWQFVLVRSLIRGQFILVHLAIMKSVLKISIVQTFKNIIPGLIAVSCMGVFGYILRSFSGALIWNVLSILFCALFYFGVLSVFPAVRSELIGISSRLIPQRFKKRSLAN